MDNSTSANRISVSPYRAHEVGASATPSRDSEIDRSRLTAANWFDGAQDLRFLESGRAAIWICLKYLQLGPGDEVCIETTTGGPYISSCVTKAIEQVCTWSRTVTPRTRLILVMHEFGFPCNDARMEQLARYNLPILEDCAYGIGSRIEGAALGRAGAFAVYSLAKHYAVPRGGILVSRTPLDTAGFWTAPEVTARVPAEAELDALRAMVAMDPATQHAWNCSRRAHWRHFAERLASLGVQPCFALGDGIVPGVFVGKLPAGLDGRALKERFCRAGVEATEPVVSPGRRVAAP